jgi:hypothetical protein
MCGGTLGICMALALQQQGLRVAVVEKRRVEGRLQEWNSSRHEMQVGAPRQPVQGTSTATVWLAGRPVTVTGPTRGLVRLSHLLKCFCQSVACCYPVTCSPNV